MTPPAFWWRAGSPAAALLAPLGALYGAVAAWRMSRAGRDVGIPVVCVGGLTLGGAGKTPAALAIGEILKAAGERPFFLTRGYGGRLKGPVTVDPSRHTAAEIGDEALLLARVAPTVVARDRIAGAQAARAAGAGVVVMDDGFQNPSLAKRLPVLVLDGRRGIGNARAFPAGPMRAPLDAQLRRARALIVVDEGAAAAGIVARARMHGLTRFNARLEPDARVAAALARRPVLAFAGIADPDKFFATLTQAGIEPASRRAFPDHHRYSPGEAAALLAEAERDDLVLLTTEKDRARLAGDAANAALYARALTLPVKLVVSEAEAFIRFVLEGIKARRGG